MTITVQFFSQLKEIAAAEVTVELREGATISDLLALLYERFPELKKWDGHILVGAGVDFVDRTHVIQPNDQIAIMPPVQGG